MPFDSERHRRQSIRLPGYDYAQAGGYFVTICTHNRESILATIKGFDSHPHETGRAVQESWDALPIRFPGILLDAFVVMPNHVHGVLFLGSDPELADINSRTLGTVLRAFKSVSAIAANRLLGRAGAPFWQRNYYERIIRNDYELNRIRQYIIDNPTKWAADPENPANMDDGLG